jgi:hypothetical protein
MKMLGREDNHSLPSSTQVKNEWIYTSTSRVYFNAMDKDNFTFCAFLWIDLWAHRLRTYVFFWGEGPRSRCYGRTAALRLIVQAVMKTIIFFLVLPCNGAPVEYNWQGKTEVLGEEPVPVLLCQPQIPHELTRDRTRASAVRGRRLTASDKARPAYMCVYSTLSFSSNVTFRNHFLRML